MQQYSRVWKKMIVTAAGCLCFTMTYAQKKPDADKLLQEALQETNVHGRYQKALLLCDSALAVSKDYVDIYLLRGRLHNLLGHEDDARKDWRQVLRLQPRNTDALQYLVNIELQHSQPAAALQWNNQALEYYPQDTFFLFKKAGILEISGEYEAAAAISRELMLKYPSVPKYAYAYHDQLLSAAKQQLKSGQDSLASQTLQTLLRSDVKNYDAWRALVNISNENIDSALVHFPGDTTLLKHKLGVLEQQKQYKAAAATAETLATLSSSPQRWHSYAQMLKGKGMKNQLSIFHLQTIYSKDRPAAGISSVQYTRFFTRGSASLRMNYGHRQGNTGAQVEIEGYYNHSPKYYSYASFSWSDSPVFPDIRAGYSLFRNFRKGWEAELGGRYLKADSLHTFTGVASGGKYWGPFWTNLRVYATVSEGKWYDAYTLTHRYYLNEKQDYLVLIGGYGNSPDDRGRNFQFNEVLGIPTYHVGLGGLKTWGYRTSTGITASWIHQEIPMAGTVDQFDVYFSLQYRF